MENEGTAANAIVALQLVVAVMQRLKMDGVLSHDALLEIVERTREDLGERYPDLLPELAVATESARHALR